MRQGQGGQTGVGGRGERASRFRVGDARGGTGHPDAKAAASAAPLSSPARRPVVLVHPSLPMAPRALTHVARRRAAAEAAAHGACLVAGASGHHAQRRARH
jgi:hypothetical protein